MVANGHETPPGYYGKWQNQFYVLDVARTVLEQTPADGDVVLVLDSDCVITGRIDEEVVGEEGLASLVIPTAADEEENGVSPRAMGALARTFPDSAWSGSSDATAPYLGGEVLAARADVLRRILDRGEELFPWALRRRQEGLPSLNEEAHLLSLAVHTLGLQWTDASVFIDRLWTQPWKFRTVRPGSERLSIWHLPAEKKTGIARLDRAVHDQSGWFWQAAPDVWLHRAGQLTSVPRYPLRKYVRDLRDLVHARLRSR